MKPKRLVQARISDDAFRKLNQLAEKDTRSMANYVERLLYEHLGITTTGTTTKGTPT